jgi:hypothetical protein
MACSHAVCRISSVIAAIFTSSLRQTRSRRSCPRRCSPRRSSVRRSITRRSTTRRPCTPLPLSILFFLSPALRRPRPQEAQICAAVRPDIPSLSCLERQRWRGKIRRLHGKGPRCLVVGSLAATPTFPNHKRTTARRRLSSFWGPRQVHGRSVGCLSALLHGGVGGCRLIGAYA